MRYTRIGVVLTVLSLISSVAAPRLVAQQREAEVLLQRAMHTEQVEGDLERAIELYGQLLADHANVRPVAARALLRLGLCYENLGRGVLPAIGGGLYDKAAQLWNAPATALDMIQENAREMSESNWAARQPAFGSMKSPAQISAEEEKYGPMRDRPANAFLRGIGKSITEPVAAFLLGSPQGNVGQAPSSPAAVDIGALDAQLLQQYTPLQIMQMSDQEKSEAIEKIRLGG